MREVVLMLYTVRKLQKMVKKTIYTLVILYLMLIAALTLFQEKLIFLPTKLPQNYPYEFTENFEEINLKTSDGALLNAIHFKVPKPKGLILYFHGNAGDLSRWGEITSFFTTFNWDVLVMDYRTYGKSTGKLSETALYKDAQLFYDYGVKHYSEDSILLYGRSLGSAFATKLASNNSPKGLILETPFYNLTSVAQSRFPIFPVQSLIKYKFKSNEYIEHVNCAITIFHGKKDKVVPYRSAQKLFEKISHNKENNFITIPLGGHNNLMSFETYRNTIKKILN